MTLDPDHVKNAIADAAGLVLDEAEAAAIARQLENHLRAAAARLDAAGTSDEPADLASVLDALAPRHG